MCGIVGRFNFRTSAPVDPDLMRRMAAMVAHRGPDGSGVYADGPIGFGHRRLAIIDLSDAGAQPMSRDDRWWITYNGEIYNFADVRTELEQHGHVFRSRTDTEVILAGYCQWGPAALSRLRGMFAFAIWDAADRTLFIARDRAGKKPLHYWLDRDGLAFASEPKAFLADPGFEVRPNLRALSHYLLCHHVPSPESAFEGVRKLPPAHYLIVKDGAVSVERYWRLSYAKTRRWKEDEAVEALQAQLREATRLRLVSDVPLGAFLSGGIDSGTVVAAMALESGARVKTFSIGFDEAAYDERAQARLVAARYGTEHHELVVRPDAIAILPDLVWHYGEPYADSSAIPTWYLAKLTRQHVTVALTGDGGDENFAGYDRYRANVLAGRLDWLPMAMRRLLGTAGRALGRSGGGRRRARLSRFMRALDLTPERRYAEWVLPGADTALARLVTPAFADAVGPDEAFDAQVETYAASDAIDFIDATLDVDVNHYLPDDLLVKVDIATMAHGLEPRAPFLDHRFMEFAASLPSSLKLRGSTTKYLVRQAATPWLPPEILRGRKRGFGVPIDAWFRGGLGDYAREVLLSQSARDRGYLRSDGVERLLDDHRTGRRLAHHQLWALLVFEEWQRMFMDRRPGRKTA
jgi:asparagine synthase (glutamine-hydrolysing)